MTEQGIFVSAFQKKFTKGYSKAMATSYWSNSQALDVLTNSTAILLALFSCMLRYSELFVVFFFGAFFAPRKLDPDRPQGLNCNEYGFHSLNASNIHHAQKHLQKNEFGVSVPSPSCPPSKQVHIYNTYTSHARIQHKPISEEIKKRLRQSRHSSHSIPEVSVKFWLLSQNKQKHA